MIFYHSAFFSICLKSLMTCVFINKVYLQIYDCTKLLVARN
jgi:hypothetical protein